MKPVDYIKNKDYIILKIFNNGTWKDILNIIHFYGKNKVNETLINAEDITESGLQLASLIFKTNKSDFKCYKETREQTQPLPVMEGNPTISSQAFWDTDFKKLDYTKHSKYIILKVCQYGKDSDFIEIVRFYGKENIRSIIDVRFAEIYEFSIADVFVMSEVKALKEQ